MLPYREGRFTKILLVVFFIFAIGYAYFEARALLYGPEIAVESRVTTVDDPFIVIEGEVRRISTLSMNGQTIAITEDGSFAEPFLLAAGYNRIVLTARDRYGKKTERTVEIIYRPQENSRATSTQAAETL